MVRIIFLFLSSLIFSVAVQASTPSQPNVLFLAVDDMNDWIGILGAKPDIKTPNIDRLAKRAVTFTRAYCNAPACNPSRVALLTGRRPSTTGIYINPQPWRPVLKDVVTLPQHFKTQGYHVLGGGKIFHGPYNDQDSWDHWEKAGSFPKPEKVPHNGISKTGHFDWGPVDATDEEMGDYHIADWAAKYLQQKHDKPFFLAPGFIRPHLPFYAPKKYFEMYPLDKIKLPETLQSDLDDVPAAGRKMANPSGDHRKVLEAKQWKHAVQAYMACISFTDAMIGKVIDALDKSAYAENTIIVLWSDHGWHLGQKEHWRKFALWEEATRVTLMISVPKYSQNKFCERPVELLDLYPTLIELCTLKPQSKLEGHSLVPLLKNPRAPWKHVSLTTHGKNNHALRSERYRYIRYADGSEELYDHEQDPYEWKNLAGLAPMKEVLQDFRQKLPKINAEPAPVETQPKQSKKRPT